jgi:hypothetical protein
MAFPVSIRCNVQVRCPEYKRARGGMRLPQLAQRFPASVSRKRTAANSDSLASSLACTSANSRWLYSVASVAQNVASCKAL